MIINSKGSRHIQPNGKSFRALLNCNLLMNHIAHNSKRKVFYCELCQGIGDLTELRMRPVYIAIRIGFLRIFNNVQLTIDS